MLKDATPVSCPLFFQSGIFQEDLYPLTAGNQAAMTAQEWLLGANRGRSVGRSVGAQPENRHTRALSDLVTTGLFYTSGPVLMSLKPGTQVANPYPEAPAEKGRGGHVSSLRIHMRPAVGAELGTHLVEEVEHLGY